MAEVNTVAIAADISLYLKTYAQAYASAGANVGPKYAKQAIESFYSSYSPIKYFRTYNLMNNSYSRYYKNNGTSISGGVRIGSSKMHEYGNGEWSAAQVASHTWAEGGHGKVFTFPPLTMAAIALGQFAGEAQKIGETAARSQNYQVLKFL